MPGERKRERIGGTGEKGGERPPPSPSRRAARGPAQAAASRGAQGPPARPSRGPEAAPSRTRERPSALGGSPGFPASQGEHTPHRPPRSPTAEPEVLRDSGSTDTDRHRLQHRYRHRYRHSPAAAPAPPLAASSGTGARRALTRVGSAVFGLTRLCSDERPSSRSRCFRLGSAGIGWVRCDSAGFGSASLVSAPPRARPAPPHAPPLKPQRRSRKCHVSVVRLRAPPGSSGGFVPPARAGAATRAAPSAPGRAMAQPAGAPAGQHPYSNGECGAGPRRLARDRPWRGRLSLRAASLGHRPPFAPGQRGQGPVPAGKARGWGSGDPRSLPESLGYTRLSSVVPSRQPGHPRPEAKRS